MGILNVKKIKIIIDRDMYCGTLPSTVLTLLPCHIAYNLTLYIAY